MLSSEEAKARLESIRVKDRKSAIARDVKRLQKDARRIGEEIVAHWDRMWGSPRSDHGPIGPRIDALEASERSKLFDAFFPRMGAEVDRAWDELKKYPYQSGGSRKGFRAPCAPNLSSGARAAWLISLCSMARELEPDVVWLAAWAGHAAGYSSSDSVGKLLAAVIDAGGKQGDEVLQILLDTAAGRHEIGTFGRFLPRALLCCNRREAWEAVEAMLLGAQREEGLRQVILETVDEAHPEAFRRIVALIAEHGLARFASVARAVDVWFGMAWDSAAARHVDAIARRVHLYGNDVAARRAALASAVAEDVYLALYCCAIEDAVAVVEVARPLLHHPNAEVRYAVAYSLGQLGHTGASSVLYEALADEDLRVVDCALNLFGYYVECHPPRPDLFERVEALLPRWPAKKQKLEPIVWPWRVHELDRGDIGHVLVSALEERSLVAIVPHLPILRADDRVELCDLIERRKGSALADGRPILVELLGDAAYGVRKKALEAFTKGGLQEGEERSLEELFARKANDLRLALVDQLLKLPDERLQASVDRLLGAKKELQRAGGLEILRRCIELDRMESWCRERASAFKGGDAASSAIERSRLDVIEHVTTEVTLEDSLGLSSADARTPMIEARDRGVALFTPATLQLLRALDALVAEHAQTVVAVSPWGNYEVEKPFGELYRLWGTKTKSGGRDAARAAMPLREVFETFWRDRPPAQRDEDGFERLRAAIHADLQPLPAPGKLTQLLSLLKASKQPPLKYPNVVGLMVDWSLRVDPTPNAPDFLADALESSMVGFGEAEWTRWAHDYGFKKSARTALASSISVVALTHRRLWSEEWSRSQRDRLWGLVRVFEHRGFVTHPALDLWFDAFENGSANEADFVRLLLPKPWKRPENTFIPYFGFDSLAKLSGQRTYKGHEIPACVTATVARVRERLVDLELSRGEHAQPGSQACASLRWTGGLDVLLRASRALSGSALRRGVTGAYSASANSDRESALSAVLQKTRPAEGETPERFVALLPKADVDEERLLEIAMYAPQWAAHVERAVGWPGLAEAVWWMHAHTKDNSWSVDKELRELWSGQTSERTPLSAADLLDGAVDVAWFGRIRDQLGTKRFIQLLDLAKFASTGTGHTRAKLFASALLGKESIDALMTRICEKRHQDTVRALGLVPLPDGPQRKQAVLDRYLLVQEFIRGAKEFGSQRQASEKRAAAIALENLARTAGFPDPVRLEWAMEREALGDLAHGSVKASAGDLEVTLSLDGEGEARLVARKGEKTLKAIPPAAKKTAEIKALVDRSRAIDKQRKRMRVSLEQAMIRGDSFSGAELADLMGHPILAPLLQRLVLVGTDLCGYPRENGRVLLGHDGTTVLVAPDARMRIAHAHDLLTGSQWSQWQRDCLRREVVQPFKQVFRELYVLTDAERADRLLSRRYAGHQVQPSQAMALLGTRGWIWTPEEGARKVDHAAGITATIGFLHAPHSPAEIDGLTIEAVVFMPRGEWKPLPLEEIPPRLFSETMRDMDLVVSVANRSGVDPEASTSSIEARAALVRETCALLGLSNVRIDGRFVFITGKIASYSVHLGSAVVHMQPGGHLCIVPVHAQSRGRMFLPFADDDPKTAEVLSKVLLLARDDKIKDPSILEQIRR